MAPAVVKGRRSNPAKAAASTGRKPRKSAVMVAPPLPPTQKGRKRRQALIEAAAAVVDKMGYGELNVARIAAQAGAPVGLFYRYFRNKSDLVLEALENHFEAYVAELSTLLEGNDFFQAQVDGIVLYEKLFRSHPGLLSCYYSYDYGEPAFAAYFQQRTLEFDRLHLERTARLLSLKEDLDVLLPVGHLLVTMVDNVVFRVCTHRDELPQLALAGDVKTEELMAALRHRLYTLADPQQADTGLASLSGRGRRKSLPLLPDVDLDAFLKRAPRRVDSTETLDTVLAITLSLLNRHSVDDMRIKDVEDQAHITRGAIYHYFNEKHDLVWAAISARLERVLASLRELHARSRDCSLRDLVAVFVEEYSRNPGVLRTLYQFEVGCDESHKLRQFRSSAARMVGELLHDMMLPEDRTPIVAAMAAYVMLATIDRFCYDTFVTPFAQIRARFPDAASVTDFLFSMFFRMLLLRNPPVTGRHPLVASLPR